MPINNNLGRMINYLDGLLPIKSLDSLIAWSCEIAWQTKIILSSLPQYLWRQDGNLPWWTHAYKVTWPSNDVSYKIMWQTKIIVSSLPQWLWPWNFTSWRFAMRGLQPCYSTLWWHGLARSRDELKLLYLLY